MADNIDPIFTCDDTPEAAKAACPSFSAPLTVQLLEIRTNVMHTASFMFAQRPLTREQWLVLQEVVKLTQALTTIAHEANDHKRAEIREEARRWTARHGRRH